LLRNQRVQIRTPFLHLRSIGGFSLIEMLVVVTLIGVAAALSIPKVARIQNEAKIQRAAQALQMEVGQAFTIAARNRSPVTMRWNSGSMQLQLTNRTGSVVYRRLGLGTGGGYGLSSSDVSVVPSPFTIFPNGLAADTLVIELARNGYKRTVLVSRAGMVRLK
jgi:prepilin-type N-terminal cleavage/methylation domain-containing protein